MSVPDVPQDVLELIERRISDQVQERVQGRLNRLYALLAAGGLVFGGFTLSEFAANVAEKRVAAIVQEKVTPTVEDTQERLEEASETLLRARVQVETADSTLERARAKADAAEEKADAARARLDRVVSQTKADLGRLKMTLGMLQARANDQLETYRDASADLATLPALNADLRALTGQVVTLDSVVQTLAEHASAASSLDGARLATVSPSLQSIVEAAQERAGQLSGSGRLTVFFQFADMPDDLAREVSSVLRTKHYVVPGEAREIMDSGTREVRYFSPADQPQAQKLAFEVEAALAGLGSRGVTIEVKPLTSRMRKPRPHTLELWLSLPEATASAGSSLGRT